MPTTPPTLEQAKQFREDIRRLFTVWGPAGILNATAFTCREIQGQNVRSIAQHMAWSEKIEHLADEIQADVEANIWPETQGPLGAIGLGKR